MKLTGVKIDCKGSGEPPQRVLHTANASCTFLKPNSCVTFPTPSHGKSLSLFLHLCSTQPDDFNQPCRWLAGREAAAASPEPQGELTSEMSRSWGDRKQLCESLPRFTQINREQIQSGIHGTPLRNTQVPETVRPAPRCCPAVCRAYLLPVMLGSPALS